MIYKHMVTPTAAIWRLRRARRAKARRNKTQFKQYKEDYLEILEELKTVGGEDAVDDLSTWMIEFTRETGQLPSPSVVRKRARHLCSDREILIPESSTLTD